MEEKEKEKTNVIFNITQVIKKSTTCAASTYKKNIDSVLGILSYALFATCVNECIKIYSSMPDSSILKALFDLFCAITLIIAKKRVKKGNFGKFFETTQDKQNDFVNNFFADENEGFKDINKIE